MEDKNATLEDIKNNAARKRKAAKKMIKSIMSFADNEISDEGEKSIIKQHLKEAEFWINFSIYKSTGKIIASKNAADKKLGKDQK